MPKLPLITLLGSALISFASVDAVAGAWHHDSDHDDIRDINTVVVIYAENRSFDSLFGSFRGANGLPTRSGPSTRNSIATARYFPACRRSGAGPAVIAGRS